MPCVHVGHTFFPCPKPLNWTSISHHPTAQSGRVGPATMEGITGGLRSKWRDIVGKERHWGRSFLKRFNVTSCARVDSCGRSAMATTSKTREHKIEHKSDHDNASHDDVVVGETKVEDKEVRVVTEQQHVVTKAEDVDVVAVDKTNGVDQAPMSQEIEDVEEDGKELDTVKKMLKKMDKTKVKDVEEDGKDQAPITTVEVLTTIDEEGPMVAGDSLAADVGDEVVLDEAFATGGQELDTNEASAAAATIGEEVIGGSSVSDEEEVNRREMAATTIQTAFRGHLARRAFRALRGLVKLQALARGSYVRRQAQVATTCMQALVRLQVRVRDRQQRRRRLPRTKAGDP